MTSAINYRMTSLAFRSISLTGRVRRGVFGWVRNPASHRDVPMDDVTHAIEQLMQASLLLCVADKRTAAHRK
jgi:hypothetical protein